MINIYGLPVVYKFFRADLHQVLKNHQSFQDFNEIFGKRFDRVCLYYLEVFSEIGVDDEELGRVEGEDRNFVEVSKGRGGGL